MSALIIVTVFAQFSVAQSHNHDHSEEQKIERFEDVSDSFHTSLTDVLEAYLSGKDALLESDLDVARAEFESFSSKLESIGEHGLSGDGHMAWMESYSEMSEHASFITSADDIDEAHSAFRQLSEELINAVQQFGVDVVVYHQYCPMAVDSDGANWLSKNENVQNPYTPETMLGCGEVIERIES